MKWTLLFAVIVCTGASLNAQIFESNFDDWNDSLPNDWQGIQRIFKADSVNQNASAATYGSNTAECINEQGAVRIMASQQLNVEVDTYYDVELWVSGEGSVRIGLFDNETSDGDGGFTPWNSYVYINSETPVSVIQQVSPEQTTTDAELLIGVNNGTLILDRVEMNIGTPPVVPVVSIEEVQSNVSSGGISIYSDSTVVLSGTVVATGNQFYYLQDGQGEWSGIKVQDFGNTPDIGDNLTMQGVIFEFQGQTQMGGISDYTVNSTGNDVLIPEVDNVILNVEAYESVIVKTSGDCVAEPANGFWLMSDGVGVIRVGEEMYSHPAVLNTFYEVTGVMSFDGTSYLLNPRNLEDVIFEADSVDSVDELFLEIEIYPNPAINELNISLESTAIGAQLFMTNALGQVVHNQRISRATFQLDVSALERGVYQLVIERDGKRTSKRLIIE